MREAGGRPNWLEQTARHHKIITHSHNNNITGIACARTIMMTGFCDGGIFYAVRYEPNGLIPNLTFYLKSYDMILPYVNHKNIPGFPLGNFITHYTLLFTSSAGEQLFAIKTLILNPYILFSTNNFSMMLKTFYDAVERVTENKF